MTDRSPGPARHPPRPNDHKILGKFGTARRDRSPTPSIDDSEKSKREKQFKERMFRNFKKRRHTNNNISQSGPKIKGKNPIEVLFLKNHLTFHKGKHSPDPG